jgi:hypothetical protein
MTIRELIQNNPNATDAEIVELANAPVYSSVPRDLVAAAVAGYLDAIYTAAPGFGDYAVQIRRFVDGLRVGLKTVDVADIPTMHALAPALVQAQVIPQSVADAVLELGVTTASYTVDDVAAERLAIALQSAKDDLLTAFETFVSAFRTAVTDATTIDELPTVPTI